jgi:hypothetical protein
MRFKTKGIAIIACIIMVFLAACENENESDNGSSGGLSHNSGQNCMNCHKSGGIGDGIFTVAGTVYNSQKTSVLSGATVKLFTEANGKGTEKYNFQTDGKGNFYTTQSISFGTGLYPAVQGSQSVKYMSSAITSGQCNSCHGVSTDRIWAE